MSGFVHLHLHSEYSLLDGACRISDIAEAAADEGQKAVALTDHGAMYGAVGFYRACKSRGVKPIIGCEVYVAARTRFDREHSLDASSSHLVLLVKDEVGYRNLCHMVSLSFTEGFYSKPRVDLDLLREYSEGLIALSGCLSGRIPRDILAGDFDGAQRHAEQLREIFGSDNFYLELQDHGIDEQRTVNRALAEMSFRTGIPLVATNDVHYIKRSDSGTQAVLMAIAMGSTLEEQKDVGFSGDEFYFKSSSEMQVLFASYENAVKNTELIAERCNFDFDFSTLKLPRYIPEDGSTPEAMLRRLSEQGLQKRTASGQIVFEEGRTESDYRERMDYELKVIHSMGYDEYFLIVCDFVGYSKSHGITTGPGRGSGAGSLVAYLIGITDVDSLRYDLLFERFLNPERVSMPDFDIDFSDERREEVIRYVEEKYGRDRVCQIITFGTLSARAAVRDVGRVLGMAYGDVDKIAKLIPQKPGMTLAKALDGAELKQMYGMGGETAKLIDIALSVEGMPRHTSTHAAGVVITDRPLDCYLPLAESCGTVVTQYDMDTVSALGLLKFDFLGLRYLTVIDKAEAQVRERIPSFDITKIPEDDPKAYALISRGDTSGVFQLESAGMRRMLTSFRPNCLADIMAAIALYRPGPMDSIPRFLAVRDGGETAYSLPELEPILAETSGCIVYQEQVMQICRDVAGYSYGRADIVRRAISKKKHDVMEREREAFVDGAVSRGIDPSGANSLFDELVSFASYAFNKSHAAAYAVTAYRTAYLKAHYRTEYMSALLASVQGNTDKMSGYMTECRRYGIKVLPPDINESKISFSASASGIRFGLSAIRSIGESFAQQIVSEREVKPFHSFDDFVNRMSGHLNKRQAEALIKSGAFDSFGIRRSMLLDAYEPMIDDTAKRSMGGVEGQIGLFDTVEDGAPAVKYKDIPELPLRDRLAHEKENTGFYFSGHPLDDYSADLDTRGAESISELRLRYGIGEEGDADSSANSGEKAYHRADNTLIGGIITRVTEKDTKRGERMAFITVEDEGGMIDTVIFASVFSEVRPFIHVGAAIAVKGRVSLSEEDDGRSISLIASVIDPLRAGMTAPRESKVLQKACSPTETKGETVASAPVYTEKRTRHSADPSGKASPNESAGTLKLFLRVPDREGTEYKKVMNLLSIFSSDGIPSGGCAVSVFDASEKKYYPLDSGVMLSTVVLDELRGLIGADNVVIKKISGPKP